MQHFRSRKTPIIYILCTLCEMLLYLACNFFKGNLNYETVNYDINCKHPDS